MRALCVLAMMSTLSCLSCGHVTLVDRDADAVYAQQLLSHTVMVRVSTPATEPDYSGSGDVVAYRNGSSYVLTVDHVCAHHDSLFSVITTTGETMAAEVVYEDPENDICGLRVDGTAGFPVGIVALPPIGAHTEHAGAPFATWARGLGVVNDGRYAGIQDGWAIVTNNSDGGSSGGGCYYRGGLFGVMVSGTRSGHITRCVAPEHLRAALAAMLR